VSASASARLGDYVVILSGFAFDAANFSDEGEIALIRIRDVLRGRSNTFYRGAYDEKYLINEGEILIGMDGEFNRARWQSAPALLNQRVCKISSSSPRLADEYLFHFLPAALKSIEDATSFVTVKHLCTKQIREIDIPLPPVEEQRRIAAILDQAETLRTQRSQALAHLDTLTQSIFLDMFGDPAVEAPKWPKTQLDRAADLVTGYPFRSEEYVNLDEGIKLCRRANVLPGRLDWRDMACWPHAKVKEAETFHLQPGDIVMAMDRPWIFEGFKLAQVDAADCPMLLVQRVARIRPKSDVTNEYLFAVLSHVAFTRHCKPTETTIPHISPKDIRSFVFPLPPLPHQQTFATRIQAIEALKATHRTALAQLDALFASLQQRAFAGEL
jgi:type I restriction enzyme S subunit